MNDDERELLALIATGEGRTLEFKRGLQSREKLARTLAAFANTRGGVLLVGVGDRGELLGAAHPEASAQALRSLARELCDPPLSVEVDTRRVANVSLVCCHVPLSPERPHRALASGGERALYVRAGSSNRVASAAQREQLERWLPRGRELEPAEVDLLAWVALHAALARPEIYARAAAIGRQRARSLFERLERDGFLLARGFGPGTRFVGTR